MRMQMLFLYVMQKLLTRKRNKIIRANLSDDMLVIGDFGCGHFANKYANVLVDFAQSDDVQRGGFKVASGAKTLPFHDLNLNQFPYPFKEKQFDFIICSHVLEHLDDPVRVCAEFSRIAKAGYIEVPNYSADLFVRNNDVIHKWLCAFGAKSGSLMFTDRKSFLSAFPPVAINIMLRFYLQLTNVQLVWRDSIRAEYATFSAAPSATTVTSSPSSPSSPGSPSSPSSPYE
ncbi:class I SAM-dependent methyltransferase [Massilia sp. TSP1-1-2]|uniref:class I SAM-dependent methyltransferase n=1 Tax=Massilia sp. TSP1-1-2 TaxID=2804649 RepID=UPI003CF1C1FF